jgi:hypothetical protein
VKFPLGRWKQGEVREYWLNCGRSRRALLLKVTIEEIDFVYEGAALAALPVAVHEGRGRGTDMRYVQRAGCPRGTRESFSDNERWKTRR